MPGVCIAMALALSAVTAATAQGAKYFRSGSEVPLGEKVPIIAWGTLTQTAIPTNGRVTCEYTAAGFVTNGFETGEGATTSFAAYNCVNPECPPGQVEVEGKKYEKDFAVTAVALPWANTLIEQEGVRVNSTGVQESLGCVAHGLSNTSPPGGTEPGKPGEQEQFYLATPTVCLSTPERRLEPLSINGKNSTVTSKVDFDARAGALLCAGGLVNSKFSGKLKVIAYKESEVIAAK